MMKEQSTYKQLSKVAKYPLLDIHMRSHHGKHYFQIALYFLAYNNRILFKAAKNIKDTFVLPVYYNTIHMRYLLLLHFIAEEKKFVKTATLRDIEFGDYPAFSKRSNKRIYYMNELVTHGFVEAIEKKVTHYKLTDKGRLAIDIVVDSINLVIRTHPNIKSRGIDTEKHPLKVVL